MTDHILMCSPTYFGIEYSINPWMYVENPVDHELASKQWNCLKEKIEELGAKVSLIDPQKGLPDMVFTANAGLITHCKTFVISTFRCPERQGEEKWFREWFEERGHVTIHLKTYFEGAGDALYLGPHLICGHGFRSDENAYNELEHVVPVKLVDPYFYHLDTCFCPLKDKDYLIWPKAFENLKPIETLGFNKIEVPEDEAKKFACNAVVIGRNVILPSGCPETMNMLNDAGYVPHSVDMSEFIKSGGSCKCLTLSLPWDA